MLESEVRRYVWILSIITILYLIIFSENGLVSYFRLKSEVKKHRKEISTLANENSSLEEEIKRIKEDPSYLEEIVRKKYGLIREGEKVLKLER